MKYFTKPNWIGKPLFAWSNLKRAGTWLLISIILSLIFGSVAAFMTDLADTDRVEVFTTGVVGALSLIGFIVGWVLLAFLSFRCAANLLLLGMYRFNSKKRGLGVFSSIATDSTEFDETEARYTRLIIDGWLGSIVVGAFTYGLLLTSNQI